MPATIYTLIVDLLSARRFSYGNEEDLQAAIASALEDAGFEPEREVRVTGGRIDLLVARVGIEVKVAGSPDRVLEQLRRYAASDEIDGLVLVTSQFKHRMPPALGGKPLACVSIAGAGL
jgi:alkanesulfonate monooxygenase SsuD/methylene tetrahydromethanopterin reductase-like flavin-dependent oxidoreductase (luciferase family)